MILGRHWGDERQEKRRLNLDGGLWLQPMGEGVVQSSHMGMGGGGDVPIAARDKSSSPGYCILMQEMFPLSLFSA